MDCWGGGGFQLFSLKYVLVLGTNCCANFDQCQVHIIASSKKQLYMLIQSVTAVNVNIFYHKNTKFVKRALLCRLGGKQGYTTVRLK